MFQNIHGRGAKPRDLRHGETITTWCGSMPSKAYCESVIDQSVIGQAISV
jgi:hypothetical protein